MCGYRMTEKTVVGCASTDWSGHHKAPRPLVESPLGQNQCCLPSFKTAWWGHQCSLGDKSGDGEGEEWVRRDRKSPSGAEKLAYVNLVKTCSPSGRTEDTVLPASKVLRGIINSTQTVSSSPSSCYPGNQGAELLGDRCHTCVWVFPMSP